MGRVSSESIQWQATTRPRRSRGSQRLASRTHLRGIPKRRPKEKAVAWRFPGGCICELRQDNCSSSGSYLYLPTNTSQFLHGIELISSLCWMAPPDMGPVSRALATWCVSLGYDLAPSSLQRSHRGIGVGRGCCLYVPIFHCSEHLAP